MMIGPLMMCVSVVLLVIGAAGGIVMGIRQDFLLGPAHAHLNLIGGVLLFLFGLYYRLIPAAGTTLLARIQGVLHIAGAIIFPAGLAVTLSMGHAFVIGPVVGSLLVLAAMVLFTVVVFRTASV